MKKSHLNTFPVNNRYHFVFILETGSIETISVKF
jgi:hypothetical protein